MSYAQKYQFKHNPIRFHNYSAMANNKESFHGLGPKLDWNASMPISGNDTDNGEITLDWGANIAVLFGRQKARGSHRTAVQSYNLTHWTGFRSADGLDTNGRFKNAYVGGFVTKNGGGKGKGGYFGGVALPTAHHTNSASHNRSRMVAVPNVGALFGISYKYQNAKVSFGYRADEFFRAMDGGIDTHKSENRGFNGPYANISIGIGG
jgi:hypothetical protein